jgi:hypothetical protein
MPGELQYRQWTPHHGVSGPCRQSGTVVNGLCADCQARDADFLNLDVAEPIPYALTAQAEAALINTPAPTPACATASPRARPLVAVLGPAAPARPARIILPPGMVIKTLVTVPVRRKESRCASLSGRYRAGDSQQPPWA